MNDRFKQIFISFQLELTDEESKGLNTSSYLWNLKQGDKYYNLMTDAYFYWDDKFAQICVKINEVDKYKLLVLEFIKDAVDNFKEIDHDDVPF